MKDQRQSNFEILRVVAMLLIVISHFAVHGTYEVPDNSTNELIALNILQIGGKLGSNLFVMIGAYFLIERSFKWQRMVTIIVQVWLYSIGILIITLFFTTPSWRRIDQSLFPFPDTYWFATTYILLLVATPLLNELIKKLNLRNYRYLLTLLTVIWVIIPTFNLGNLGSSNFTWFVYLYLLVGYIKEFPENWQHSPKQLWYFNVILYVLTIGFVVWFHLWSYLLPDKLEFSTIIVSQHSLFIVLLSIGLFLLAKNSKTIISPQINRIASLMFAVYLIHEHPIIRDFIWQLVDSQSISGGAKMFIIGLLESIIIFLITTIIALISEKLFQPVLLRTIEFLSRYIKE